MAYKASSLSSLPPVGSLVRVHGLSHRRDLNGKFGLVKLHPETVELSRSTGDSEHSDVDTIRIGVRVYELVKGPHNKGAFGVSSPAEGDWQPSECTHGVLFLEDVSARCKNLKLIEVCVLVASHLTSVADLNKLCVALHSTCPVKQYNFDDYAAKPDMVYFRPKVLLSYSADRTNEALRVALDEAEPGLLNATKLGTQFGMRAVVKSSRLMCTQFEHYQQLLPEVPRGRHSFVLFHEDDGCSSLKRFVTVLEAVIELLEQNESRARDRPEGISIRWSGVARRERCPGVDLGDRAVPSGVIVEEPKDVDNLIERGALKVASLDEEGDELYSQCIVADYVWEFFGCCPPHLLRSSFADLALSKFIRHYSGGSTVKCVLPRDIWLYFSNSLGVGTMLVDDSSLDKMRKLLEMPFYRSSCRIIGIPELSDACFFLATERSNCELSVISSTAAFFNASRVSVLARLSEEVALGSSCPERFRGMITWSDETGTREHNPVPIQEYAMTHFLDKLLMASGSDVVQTAVRRMLMLDMTLRVLHDLDMPVVADAYAQIATSLRDVHVPAAVRLLQQFVPRIISAAEVEEARSSWLSYARDLENGTLAGQRLVAQIHPNSDVTVPEVREVHLDCGNTQLRQHMSMNVATASTENTSPESGECVICCDNEALFVIEDCGHLVCCTACRRKLVHAALVQNGRCHDTNRARKEILARQLKDTRVKCPMCQGLGKAIDKARFPGKIYVCSPF